MADRDRMAPWAEVRQLVNLRWQWRVMRYVEIDRPHDAGPSLVGPFMEKRVVDGGEEALNTEAQRAAVAALHRLAGDEPLTRWIKID